MALRNLVLTVVYWLANPWVLPMLLFLGAFLLMFFVGEPMIDWLKHKRWRQDAESWQVREDTPATHQAKQGTPSMGGLGIIGVACFAFIALSLTLGALAYSVAPNVLVWPATVPGLLLVPVFVAAHALLGFTDDWSKAAGRGGLSARAKLMVQLVLACLFITAWVRLAVLQSYNGVRFLYPVVLTSPWPLFWCSLAAIALIVIGTCNAVNLTDGIDGLAAGLAVQAGFGLWLTSPNIYEIGYMSNLFWAALAGSCLGFLWFNRHPARVFMGDTGSLAIGAALGLGAVLCKAVVLLPFIGFIYFTEMFSVLLQVAYFKWTRQREGQGRRIFRRAPLHHHFELSGWTEWRVVLTFWFVNLVVASCGLFLWSVGVLPQWPR